MHSNKKDLTEFCKHFLTNNIIACCNTRLIWNAAGAFHDSLSNILRPLVDKSGNQRRNLNYLGALIHKSQDL